MTTETAPLSALLITYETLDDFIGLRVRTEEEARISQVPDWLAEAAHAQVAVTFGLMGGGEPVGLISLIDPRVVPEDERDGFHSDCLYVWRVMTDHRARGRGFGRAALDFAQGYARLIGLAGVSLTTADNVAETALGFYDRIGFRRTGRRVHDEVEYIRRHDAA